MNHDPDIYDNFEFFIARASLEMNKRNTLTYDWLKIVSVSFGAVLLLPLVTGAAMRGFRATKNISKMLIPFLGASQKKLISKFLDNFKKENKRSDFDIQARLEKIEQLYHEFSTLSREEKIRRIDELFEDVVSGNEIYY